MSAVSLTGHLRAPESPVRAFFERQLGATSDIVAEELRRFGAAARSQGCRRPPKSMRDARARRSTT